MLGVRSRPFRIALNLLLGGAGIAFIVVALRRSLTNGWQALVPSWPRYVAAEVLLFGGLLGAAEAWRTLLSPVDEVHFIRRGFYVSQLAKYIPGGFWQPVGQVSLAASSGVPTERAIAAFPAYVAVLVVSGMTVGAGTGLTAGHLSLPARIAAVAGFGSIALLNRRWMCRGLLAIRRVISWLPAPEEIPSQRSIIRAYCWNALTIALSASAFAILSSEGLHAVFAFAAAWTVGYIVVLVPSGLGVREAVLIGLVGLPAGTIVGASVAHRVATMVAELVLAAAASAQTAFSAWGRQRSQPRSV